MGKNNFIFILLCFYFAFPLSGRVRSLSNTRETNHANRTEEENRQTKDEAKKETVETDDKLTNYTNHLSKEYQSIFKALKDKAVETKTNEEIDFLARSYDNKFKEIANKTKNLNIKTISGRRTAILDTFDSANVILDNLVNHLIDDLKGNSNEDEISAGLVKDEAAKIVEREKVFICEQFNICREIESFADFMLEILTITSKLNHRKLGILVKTFKDVAKKAGIDTVRDSMTQQKFIEAMDRADHPFWSNFVLTMLKNIIEHRSKPLAALGPEPNGQIVAKAHAFIEALEAMEKVSPPTKENKELWKDIEISFKNWTEKNSKESELKDIMQKLMNHIHTGVKSYYVGKKGEAKLENIINILTK